MISTLILRWIPGGGYGVLPPSATSWQTVAISERNGMRRQPADHRLHLRRFSGDRRANQIRESLTAKLMQRHTDAATEDWHWFEEVVSYANAKLPHAMILNGRCLNNATMLELGLKTLRWLI